MADEVGPPMEQPAPSAEQGKMSPVSKVLLAAGVLLLVLAIGIGLWLWLGPDDESDYEADCKTIEAEAPELSRDLTLMMQTIGASNTRRAWISHMADRWREIAAKLNHEQLAADFRATGDKADEAMAALEREDHEAVMQAFNEMIGVQLVQHLVDFLTEHCERWLGPGVWDTPGAPDMEHPTEAPDLTIPTIPEIPTVPENGGTPGMPDDEMPTIPDLPELPSGFPTPSG